MRDLVYHLVFVFAHPLQVFPQGLLRFGGVKQSLHPMSVEMHLEPSWGRPQTASPPDASLYKVEVSDADGIPFRNHLPRD